MWNTEKKNSTDELICKAESQRSREYLEQPRGERGSRMGWGIGTEKHTTMQKTDS